MKKKVLIITYHFPPFRTGGVYRHLKFSKYLPEFGWEPIILTVKNPGKQRIDRTLMADVSSDLSIYHTRSFELRDKKKKASFLYKIFSKLLKKFLMIPDENIGWLFCSLYRALKIIRKHNITVFCTTSPPHSTHLIGLLLKFITRRKWVVDFRDPWTQSFMKKAFYKKNRIRYFIECFMEKKVIEYSDKVVVVTKSQKTKLLRKYPRINDKTIVITNGFDETDFKGCQSDKNVRPDSKIVITHIGRVYPGKSYAFLKSYKELMGENEDFRRNNIVNFIGPPSIDHINEVNRLELQDDINTEGFHEHDQIIQDMLNADLLLLMVGTERFWIPGKVFEYIRSQRPILVIGNSGEASNIALKSGLGELVSHEDIVGIKNKILEAFDNKKHNVNKIADIEYIMNFSRKNLTGKFAKLLDTI